ncbi:MAG: signal peptidase I [Bacilli bacterium]|nr:signal peptidase I [Bacilli bacterium]
MTSKKILNLIRIISLIVLAIIIGLNIYMWNANKILGDAMPMPSGFGAAVILSGSMEPALSIDDLIIVKKCDDYDIGDIIVYQRNYELIVHRIVEIDENNVITKGDANNIYDKAIDISSIKGRVILTIPVAGKLIEFIKSPIGIIITISLSVFLYIYSNKKEKKIYDIEIIEIEEEIEKFRR